MKTLIIFVAAVIISYALAQIQCNGCNNIINLPLDKCGTEWTNQVLTCQETPCNVVYSEDPWVQYCGRTPSSTSHDTSATIVVQNATATSTSTSSTSTTTSSADSASSTTTTADVSSPTATIISTTILSTVRVTVAPTTTARTSAASSSSAPGLVLFGVLAVIGAFCLV